MELKYFVIVLSFACIFFLYFLSTLNKPIMINLQEIQDYEDKTVTVEGVVKEHRVTKYGSQIIEIIDVDGENHSNVIIFVEGETLVEYGDRIQVTGIVKKYEGEWEVVVNNPRFVKIIEKWSDISFPLWQLAENPNRYVGANVNVTGFIERVYSSYFYLVDSEEQYSIVVYYDSSKFSNLSQGVGVYVGGRFVYDEETLRFVLDVSEETHYISLMDRV